MKVAVMLLFMANLADGMLVPSNLNSFSINRGVNCSFSRARCALPVAEKFKFKDFNGGVCEHARRVFYGSKMGPFGFVASVIGAFGVVGYKLKKEEENPYEAFFAGLYGAGTAMMMYSHFHKNNMPVKVTKVDKIIK